MADHDAHRRTVRDNLLDAAYDAAVTTGWARARMADVAAAAGVSRQTLYDQFGSRDGLAQALAMRELARFLDGTEAAMAPHGDLVVAIEAAVTFALTAARDNPLIRAVLTENGEDGLLPLITTRAEPVLVAARERLRGYLPTRWPGLDPGATDAVGEVATRLILSYVVLPGDPIPAVATRIASVVARVLDLDRRSVW